VRKYLSSDAAEEEKKSKVMYRDDLGRTCLYVACCHGTPDDIIKIMLDIGGKELFMKKANNDRTVLHSACGFGASYNIIKMLIEVGGKDLIMAKDTVGYTALHYLCWFIEEYKVAEKIKLILQVGDANLLLSTKDYDGKTPLEIATDYGASNIIKELLTLQSKSNSTRRNNSPSTNIVPAENNTLITQSNQEQDTTRSSSTNNDRNIPIRGLAIDQNHQRQLQLREAKEKAKTIQQDFDQKCIDYSDLEENYRSQLKEAKEQTLQIQQDYDQKCADCCHLKEENQVENTVLKKELYKCKRTNVDLEHKVEAQGAAEISLLAEQKEKGEKENKYWKDKVDNYMQICSEYKAKLQEMKDKVGAPVAGTQMIKQEEGEAARAQELLEESNRRAADLEATVEAQRLENADLSNEKDGIEKEYMDKIDNLTRKLSKQQAELQQLKKSSSDVEEGMKRKHTNEEHEEGKGTVAQSQTQSSKRRRVGNMRHASNSTVTTAATVFPKPNVTIGNVQICKPNENEERTPKQDYILLIRRFKRFLFNISNTVDTSWPVLEQHIQYTKINATEFLSNQKISTNLLGFHKFGINLISTRKSKIVYQKAKIRQIKTLEEIHHIYKIIFAEIYLLKQACEKGVKCYDDVLQVVSNAKLELQLNEMQHLLRNLSDFVKKMHETREVLQKLFNDRNLVVPNEKNVTAKVRTQDSSGSNVDKHEVGKASRKRVQPRAI
jgi:hypothetical protein